jgi:hypothetical protein
MNTESHYPLAPAHVRGIFMENLELDSLSLLDLDVELLEERIELSTIGHPSLYGDICRSNCESNKPVLQ